MTERGSSSTTPLRTLGAVGLALAVPAVLMVTLWPTHFLLRAKPRIVRGLEWFHTRGMLEWVYWTRLEVLANVAMFVPLALLVTFVLGARRWWLALLLCVALSAGVELAQHVLLPGRVATVRDVIANGLGAAIGVLLATVIEGIVRLARRRAASPPTVAPPR
ncbi:VanZ family protein [Agrococcus carbonis]|uniref:VanZ like family protein n=1 Tax=Agrococcus carbonis TaxID=684552 RepID=A0A1H1RH67_9MICO|nr:VanZ family protein [Agrococcus carbonis]SDS35040.1 VanZ like family protein [Agrococcus carbonis]